jgi:ABC-2 type transport system permease protein
MRGLGVLLKKSVWSTGNLGRILREQSVFKILIILLSAGALFGGLGMLFYSGFKLLTTLGGAGLMVIHRMFSLFFFGLGIMLVFSSIVTSYATIYRSDEIPFLLLRPIRIGEIVVYKFLESAVLASWAFFFMILPFVGAYAAHQDLTWLFGVWTFLFSVPFVVLCCALGTLVCLIVVRWLPGGKVLKAILSVLFVTGAWFIWRAAMMPRPVMSDETLILAKLIPGMRMAGQPMLPSWWVAEGMMALSRSAWHRGFLLWGVLVSSTLVAMMVVEEVGRRVFYEGWQRGISLQAVTRRNERSLRFVRSWLSFLRTDVCGLLVKDMRIFLRDPMQWTQVVVFFGLLAIYFVNLRNLNYHTLGPGWRNLIVFLNLFSVSAVISSLSSRFIFPQMSLEGHSFWVLGLSPLSMARILRAKFAMSCVVLVAISASLMEISTAMLKVDTATRLVSIGLGACIAIALSGMSAGFGAVFLDLKQRNPAAIVSSFGGTLNLVVGMIYVLSVIVPVSMLFHMRAMENVDDWFFRRGFGFLAAFVLIATFLIVYLPMRLGRKSLEEREY